VAPVPKYQPHRLLLPFLAHLKVVDVALFLKNAGDLHLELGTGHFHPLVPGVNTVPDASEHVRDGVRSCHRSPLGRGYTVDGIWGEHIRALSSSPSAVY